MGVLVNIAILAKCAVNLVVDGEFWFWLAVGATVYQRHLDDVAALRSCLPAKHAAEQATQTEPDLASSPFRHGGSTPPGPTPTPAPAPRRPLLKVDLKPKLNLKLAELPRAQSPSDLGLNCCSTPLRAESRPVTPVLARHASLEAFGSGAKLRHKKPPLSARVAEAASVVATAPLPITPEMVGSPPL